jgi:Transposase
MHIAYTKKNGVEYAALATSKRKGATVRKTYVNLGRVIDKEHHIFKSRERGTFHYDPESGVYSEVNDTDSRIPVKFPDLSTGKEELILDFGDIYFLDAFEEKTGLHKILESVSASNCDTLKAMVNYYILCHAANCHAQTWWEGSYARLLYKDAALSSQRISEFLADIGSEETYRSFFKSYYPFMNKSSDNGCNVLIDSTGLPNSIHFPLTAISNHNGEISNEVRLIYVIQQETGLPLYFRYCPGNVIDVSTLIRTMKELKQNGINTKFAILDAGYYDEKSICELYENKISFVTRLKQNRKLYKQLLHEHLDTLESKENFVNYNSRYVYLKCVECTVVDGHKGYAYIGLDIERKGSETRKLFQRAKDKKLTDDEVFDQMERHGVFIILSSRRIAKDKILPTYYSRQQIEQVFDIGKNYADMLPLRVQNEDTFRGHLLLTFIACLILKIIQDQLKNSKYNPISMLMNLRNQKCKVYAHEIVTTEAVRKMNDCYKIFDISCPVTITRD